ncbi:MAG: hypothetical protein ACFB0B_03830 [Thermonemataceae bacterium]
MLPLAYDEIPDKSYWYYEEEVVIQIAKRDREGLSALFRSNHYQLGGRMNRILLTQK